MSATPVRPTPHPTPPPDAIADPEPDGRERLIRAGWRAVDQLPLPKVFAGATTASVAHEAGVTTGSFFHHFANSAEFADALTLSYLEDMNDDSDSLEGLAESLEHIGLIELMRTALTDTWQVFNADEAMCARLRGQMLLWAHHDAPLSSASGPYSTPADVLRQGYRARETAAVAGWEEIVARTGRVMLEPFTLARIATALNALFEGLRIRAEVDPEAVDDEIFGDISAAIASIVTGPRGGRPQFEHDTVRIVNDDVMSPQARSGARRRRESRQRVLAASIGMFSEGWESVTASDVAEQAGVSSQTIVNLFRSVRGVAAATFGRHASEIRRVALDLSDADPWICLRETLAALAERAASDPEPARALLSERLEVTLHRGGSLGDMDIRLEVPLADAVMLSVGKLDLGAALPIDVSTMLINFVLCSSIGRIGATSDVADLAMRLLPPSAAADQRR